MDELVGPRRRQLERPLRDLESLRRERQIDVGADRFGLEVVDDGPAGRLGA
jgi:hypothetical protein